MGLFGKSFEDKVNDALETVRGQFPQAKLSAKVADKVVTLQGEAPDLAAKSAIMAAFNALVETDNTINQISLAKPPAAAAASPAAAPHAAPAAATPAAAPQIHEVVKGETLSAIAKKYYGNANKYMKIYEANRDILSNPDLIKVGQKLKIPS